MNLRNIYTPLFIQEWVSLLKTQGIKGFIKEKGWKILLAIFLFYLVRDTILYIIIPVLIARGIIAH
jgi:hypothetical protein